MFDDSIAPIERAGQLHLWQHHHDIPELPISLEAAPGHTPGSSVVRLRAGEHGAVFVGDLLHSPMQLLHPDHRCSFDLDPVQARASRRDVLAQAAADGAMILPAHFPGHSAASIAAAPNGNAYRIASWAGFHAERAA